MNKIRKYVFIIALGIIVAAASDSRAAPVLCKVGFACPIVANMSINGPHYANTEGPESTWTAEGLWGSGGATILVNGRSRCSGTGGADFGIGDPASGGGRYCWCQPLNNGVSGAWVLRGDFNTNDFCATHCGSNCGYYFMADPVFRAAVCVPPASQNNYCDGTTFIADGACPAGYIPCVGTGTGGNAAGAYTITCSG